MNSGERRRRHGNDRLQNGMAGLLSLLLLSGCSSLTTELAKEFGNLPSLDVRSLEKSLPQLKPQSTTTTQMEAQVRQQINAIRQKDGLGTLKNNDKLAQVARQYSQKMAKQNFFSHTSPQGDSMVDRVRSAGISYRMLGENLFTGTNLPQPVGEAVQGWMESPGHRENILRPEFEETGIGVWRTGNTYYFTQLFMQ
jgi:uncharacterized protein YkwD